LGDLDRPALVDPGRTDCQNDRPRAHASGDNRRAWLDGDTSQRLKIHREPQINADERRSEFLLSASVCVHLRFHCLMSGGGAGCQMTCDAPSSVPVANAMSTCEIW